MYARKNASRDLTFDFAEGLINNNLLMVDRETGSVWSQLEGKAVSGQLQNTPLKVVPSMQTTWGFWRRRHPDTRVMKASRGRPYFYRTWVPGTPRPASRPSAHDTANLGLGLNLAGESWFFPLSELARSRTPFPWRADGQTVTIFYSAPGMTAWAQNEQGKLLPAVLAYRKGWFDFFPGSHLWKAGRPQP